MIEPGDREDCKTFKEGNCSHEAYQGAECPPYKGCLFWVKKVVTHKTEKVSDKQD